MRQKETYYVSRKNPLTWISALILLGSVGIRIADICGKGADAQTIWMRLILPASACILYALILLLDGREHFYRTLIPVTMMAVYFVLMLVARHLPMRYIFLNGLLYLAFLIFYKQITSGYWKNTWFLTMMYTVALAMLLYDSRSALLHAQWKLAFWMLQDLGMLLSGFLVCFALKPHLDGRYHPTWGDRKDGRRVRTIQPMNAMMPYIMEQRNESNNFIRDEVEISNIESYVREKRKAGMTSFGITHVFLAAYVRAIAKYPAMNRFLAGQRIYSRGNDIQFSMVIKKEMSLDGAETTIKVHFHPGDTADDVYRKMEEAITEAKSTPLDANVDRVAYMLTMLPRLLLRSIMKFLRFLDYFGLLPGFLLEVSPFHGSVFFTSMGSLGIPAVVHHLYDFGTLPVFVAFGCKYRRNEIDRDGTILHKKYVDVTYNLDERTCDGYYYAAVLKYMRRLLANPWRLDTPPEKIEQDIP